jgi:ethanolamine utilization cobalamin adenosyltransferase
MSTVVTQAEIKCFKDNECAVFPVGTIITPSAKEWASEHNIHISFGEPDSNERLDLLRNTVSAVLKEFAEKGQKPDVKTVSELVCKCLNKLGCKVD